MKKFGWFDAVPTMLFSLFVIWNTQSDRLGSLAATIIGDVVLLVPMFAIVGFRLAKAFKKERTAKEPQL
jgi:hypothetical protein